MERTDSQSAQAKLAQLKSDYQVEVVADWGDGEGGWHPGTWARTELDRLHSAIDLMVDAMGGKERFVHHLGGVTVRKSDIGTHGGEALAVGQPHREHRGGRHQGDQDVDHIPEIWQHA